jgi:hypothetical protein
MGGEALMAQENVFGHLVPQQDPPPAASSSVPQGIPTAPGVIYGRPKAQDPQDQALKGIQIQRGQADLATQPFDVRTAAANATKAEADARRTVAGGDKTATQLELEAKADGAQKRKATVNALLGNVRSLYEKDIAGKPLWRGFGLGEYIDMIPTNERFTAAGNAILPLIRPLVAQTAKEGDSDKEMQVFQSYIPSADDSDITIEGKIKSLEILIGGMVDGKPPSQTDAELRAAFQQQRGGKVTVGGQEYRSTAPDPEPTITPRGPDFGQSFMQGVGDIAQGFGDALGVVGNPLNATINAATGSDFSTDLGRSLRTGLGLPEGGDPVASAAIRAGTGALALGGLAGVAGRSLPGAAGSALEIMGSQPGRQVGASAAAGATGEQLNREGVGPAGQIGGSLLAGGLTYSGMNALANTANRAMGAPNALLAAGQRQGVDILPADAGGAATRRITSAAAQAPVSASPVVSAAQRQGEQFKSAVQRTAGRQGDILDTDVAGDQVRKAGEQYVKNESARIGRLYDTANSGAKGVTIKPLQALANIDEQIARYGELGDVGAPVVKSLQSIRSSIENGVSVQGMRDARTILSQGVYDGKLRSGQEKAMLGKILEDLSSDIELGLKNAGRGQAAQTFKRADTLWRERIQYIDDTLEPVIGKGKSGEDVLKALEGMMRGSNGGAARLRGIMKEMPPEQAGNVRATVIDRLGRATAGNQDDVGGEFSASTFLTNWNRLTPQAKAVMFSDDRLRANLNDIAKIANASKEAGRYANHSNTSSGMLGNVGAGLGIAAVSPTAAAVTIGSQYLTGQLLASPRFTAWLARAPKNPQAQGRYIEQLSVVAAKEPAIAGEARALQQYLGERLTGSPRSAVAGEQDENGGPKPPQ